MPHSTFYLPYQSHQTHHSLYEDFPYQEPLYIVYILDHLARSTILLTLCILWRFTLYVLS